ncbi:MAG: ATP synthase F1 subunit epsilon [Deltaproteobacteria bacterium]|jgi:F-type H+-transporting ATPase subunit epsilon|nr:ATP synthase F1 subunit epsilon [Deltaproteobacteria bacterium]
MSDRTFNLIVVSPDRALVNMLPVTAVGAAGSEGEFTAMPGHEPFLTDLKDSNLWFREPGSTEKKEVFVGGGFIEVLPDRVTVLANSCEYTDEIDEERAARAVQRREIELKNLKAQAAAGQLPATETEIEIRKVESKLYRSIARQKAAKKRHNY